MRRRGRGNRASRRRWQPLPPLSRSSPPDTRSANFRQAAACIQTGGGGAVWSVLLNHAESRGYLQVGLSFGVVQLFHCRCCRAPDLELSLFLSDHLFRRIWHKKAGQLVTSHAPATARPLILPHRCAAPAAASSAAPARSAAPAAARNTAPTAAHCRSSLKRSNGRRPERRAGRSSPWRHVGSSLKRCAGSSSSRRACRRRPQLPEAFGTTRAGQRPQSHAGPSPQRHTDRCRRAALAAACIVVVGPISSMK